jgi:hypothetical protein
MNGETKNDPRKAAYWGKRRAENQNGEDRRGKISLPGWMLALFAEMRGNGGHLRSSSGWGRRGPLENRARPRGLRP